MTFTWSTTRRRIAKARDYGVFLIFRAKSQDANRSHLLRSDMARAVATANAAVAPRTMFGGSVIRPLDACVAVPLFWDGVTYTSIRPWLDVLADELARAGHTGKLSVVAEKMPRLWRDHALFRSGLTLYLGYPLHRYPPRGEQLTGWLGEPETTSSLTQSILRWGSGPSDLEFWAGLLVDFVEIPEADAQEFLQSSANVGTSATLCLHSEVSQEMLQVTLCHRGEVIAQSTSSLGRRAELESLIALIREIPPDVQVGHVKLARPGACSWLDLEHHILKPRRYVTDYAANRHLWDEYVIDAHGVNLLTEKHLAKAHDLSGWEIDEILPGRYLVSARSPEDWFGSYPSLGALERARNDFGAMILDWDVIVERPGPYTNRNPDIIGRGR